jgi:hypothetical protein
MRDETTVRRWACPRFCAAILFLLWLNGCAQSAAQHADTEAIRKGIVGTWSVDKRSPAVSLIGESTIRPDGSFVSTASMVHAGESHDVRIEGTWTVENDVLVETVIRSNVPEIPIGHITRDEIISVDEKRLVFKTERGKEVVESRSSSEK